MKSINPYPTEETDSALLRQRTADQLGPTYTSRLSWLVLGLITLLYVAVSFTPTIFDDNEGLYTGAVR